MEDFFEKLLDRTTDATKIVFLGIGEEKLSDDGLGPFIIGELTELSNEKTTFLNAGTDPMARIDEIVDYNPSHLILLDTCTLDKEPGTVAIIERFNLKDVVPISSHTIPIHIVIDLIRERLPNLDVFMIGIVPKSLEGFTDLKINRKRESALLESIENIEFPFFEIQLTPLIQNVVDELVEIIKKLIKTMN